MPSSVLLFTASKPTQEAAVTSYKPRPNDVVPGTAGCLWQWEGSLHPTSQLLPASSCPQPVRCWPPPSACFNVQGEKTFCASFCASLIAGSRRAFLCVDWVCLLEFWTKCTRCERLLPVKHFYLTCLLFFRRLKITLDSEQPMLKEKRIIPSVWGGIKGFEHFLRGEYFSDCASD